MLNSFWIWEKLTQVWKRGVKGIAYDALQSDLSYQIFMDADIK